MATISVIIPAFNQASFIADALSSVLAQSRQALEVIVVDDGSTDATPACVNAFGSQVHYLRQENLGLAGARNTGFLASRGDYVLFLDGDDVLHPEMLERLGQHLDTRPELSLAYCGWEQISQDGGEVLGVIQPRREGALLQDLLLRQVFFFPSCTLIRRAAINQVGLFDASLSWSEDADLWLRLASTGHLIGYVDRRLVQYRIHTSSMTSRIDPKQVADSFRVLERILSMPGLPVRIRELDAAAHRTLHFEAAGRYLRVGLPEQARQHLRAAVPTGTQPDHAWILQWIAGTALDPRTVDPDRFVVRTVELLRDLSSHWSGIDREAMGQYHAAAAFAADANGAPERVVRHAWTAVIGRPAVLLNRGFLRIAVSSLMQVLLERMRRPAGDQQIVADHEVARAGSRP